VRHPVISLLLVLHDERGDLPIHRLGSGITLVRVGLPDVPYVCKAFGCGYNNHPPLQGDVLAHLPSAIGGGLLHAELAELRERLSVLGAVHIASDGLGAGRLHIEAESHGCGDSPRTEILAAGVVTSKIDLLEELPPSKGLVEPLDEDAVLLLVRVDNGPHTRVLGARRRRADDALEQVRLHISALEMSGMAHLGEFIITHGVRADASNDALGAGQLLGMSLATRGNLGQQAAGVPRMIGA